MSINAQREGFEHINLQFEKLSKDNPQGVAGAIELLTSTWDSAGKDLQSQFPELYPSAPKSDAREYNKNYWVVRNEKTGEAIGVVGYSEFEGDKPQHAWLGWFCVTSKLRGSRLGPRLLDHVIRELKVLGKTDLYVQTSDRPDMVGNEKFYNQNGFPVVAHIDTSNVIHISPEAGDLSSEVVRTIAEVNDPASASKGITDFVRRRNLAASHSL